jgi:hypothetical protein
MKKFLYSVIILFLVETLSFASYNGLNNIAIANSCILSTEQSVIDNYSFNVISNPAMLGINTNIDYLLEYNKLLYYAQTSYDNIGFLIGKNSFGIVINKFSSGQINVRDIDGVDVNQTIEYSITTLNFAAATELIPFNKTSKLYGGIAGSMNWEVINVETISYNVNIGLVYNYEIKNNVFRLGTVIKGLSSKDTIVYHCGSLVKIGHLSFIGGYENNLVDSFNGKLKIGLMIDLPLPYLFVKNISFGIGYLWGNQNKYLSQITTGLSIKFNIIIFGYSFITHQYLGTTQNFYIGIKL